MRSKPGFASDYYFVMLKDIRTVQAGKTKPWPPPEDKSLVDATALACMPASRLLSFGVATWPRRQFTRGLIAPRRDAMQE